MGELPGFVLGDVTAEHLAFAVAEPFLQYLVSANRVFPDSFRHVAPEGFAVEVDVYGLRAPQRRYVLRLKPQFVCSLGDAVLFVGCEVATFLDSPTWHHN